MFNTEDSAREAQDTNFLHDGHITELETFTIEVSLFPRLLVTSGTQETWNWQHIVKKLTSVERRFPKDGPMISSTIYKDGLVNRGNENVESVTGLFLDFDEVIDIKELDAIVTKLGARAILSPSHSFGTPDVVKHPDSPAPGERYRVFFPLRMPVSSDKYPELWERANELFDGRMDEACKDISRAYYLPAHPNPVGLPFKVYEGKLLEIEDLPSLSVASLVLASYPSTLKPFTAVAKGVRVARPGDDYDLRATNEVTALLLEKHGWTVSRSEDGQWKATRPNKNGVGISATIGFHGPGDLFVFSSNAFPFEANHNYTPFYVFAFLEHSGDLSAAAKALKTMGFTGGAFPLELSAIPEPTVESKDGKRDYNGGQLVKLIYADWTVSSLWSDGGHAARICEALGRDLRFSGPLGWLSYGGRFWERDDKAATQTSHKALVLSSIVENEAAILYRLSADLLAIGRSEAGAAMGRAASAHLSRIGAVEDKQFVKDSLHFAAGHPKLRVLPEVFDLKPWFLSFQNVVWDKGVLREHRREDFQLSLCPPVLNEKADQTEWLRVLEAMTGGDKDLQKTLQDVAGYALSGASHLRTIVWLYGPKGTGKSTFAELLHTVLGKMAAIIEPKNLQKNSVRERLGAILWNKRLAICTEAGGQPLQAELLKTLSGGDTLTIRHLYAENFDAKPSHVLMLVSNDPPEVNAYDDALKDRVLTLPFIHPLDGCGKIHLSGGTRIEEVRKNLNSPLVEAFTAWAVEGMARVYKNNSIYRAPSTYEATKSFWKDADDLTPFWDTIEESDLREGIPASLLRGRYESWCESEGIKPLKGKALGKAFRSRGLEDEQRGSSKSRARCWVLPGKPVKSDQLNLPLDVASDASNEKALEFSPLAEGEAFGAVPTACLIFPSDVAEKPSETKEYAVVSNSETDVSDGVRLPDDDKDCDFFSNVYQEVYDALMA